MKMLDIFTGICGFSLAAYWIWKDDLDIKYFVEIDPFCQKIIKLRFPGIPIHPDIKDFHYHNEIDLITGGFPCQDISIAGKGEGIGGERSGLWSEYKRIISECRPKFALIENVPALTFRGLDRILCDLAEIGYNAEWQSISASEVGAWHKRERIWILAYPVDSTNRPNRGQIAKEEGIQSIDRQTGCSRLFSGTGSEIPDTECEGFNKEYFTQEGQASRCGSGFKVWSTEPELGRVAHGIPNRVDRLKSLGNAIVPQVAYIIMQQLKRYI